MSRQLNSLDQAEADLQARFGDAWHVWFVLHATGRAAALPPGD